MGKKGDALRAAKAQKAVYTFTREQLEEHDDFVRRQFRDRVRDDVAKKVEADTEARKAEIDKYLTEEWKRREEIFNGINEGGDGFFNILSLLLATSSRILIEKFGWRPIPKDGVFDKRNKTAKFADYLVDEINMITQDENADIRRYVDETYDLYGIKFITEDVTDDK